MKKFFKFIFYWRILLYRILLFSVKPQHESAVSIHICPFATIIQHHSGCPSYSNQRRKRNKRNPDQKISKALTVCRWHDTVHRKPWRQYQRIPRANQWTLGDGDGQGGLVCYDSWGRKESDMTERLNWTEPKSLPPKPQTVTFVLP